ncbi:hypothetical protein [Listeria booriae]|uniref:hypothetical protein n=1 Tax=Listeria booriae TaxID=1552123 RepID=UPI0016233F18|nr:hypothetical protein [Listeria booriae]MBC2036098.1 hypothetical protein [Listeria booriae]MBC2169332.1 hypothetical protein [Listeria booriae]
MRRGSFVVVLCCGSYEAYFAELEPQYAYERSEYAIHVGSHVSRYEIQLCCGSYEALFAELEPQYAVE